MKPLKNYLLVAETQKENKTESGLILSTDIDTGSKPALIVAVGPDVVDVSPGDVVALKWSDGMPVTVEGNQGVLISDESVYAIY